MRRKKTSSFAEEDKKEGSKAVREDMDGLKVEYQLPSKDRMYFQNTVQTRRFQENY